MQDNFNLKGYLRHGNKLLNEGIGGYFDLKPINNLNEAPGGQASLELDWAAGMPALEAKCEDHGLTFDVVEEVGPAGGNPLVKIMGPKESIIEFLKDGYVNDEEELEMFAADIKDGGVNELEKPEKIYADDDSFVQAQRDAAEGDYDDEDFVDGYQETENNAKSNFQSAINSLRQMDFSDRDIIDLFKKAFSGK